MKTFRDTNEITKEVLKDESFKSSEELPIDAHMKRILSHIRSHRCTVIHGETGFHFFYFFSYFMKFNFYEFRLWKIFKSTRNDFERLSSKK